MRACQFSVRSVGAPRQTMNVDRHPEQYLTAKFHATSADRAMHTQRHTQRSARRVSFSELLGGLRPSSRRSEYG